MSRLQKTNIEKERFLPSGSAKISKKKGYKRRAVVAKISPTYNFQRFVKMAFTHFMTPKINKVRTIDEKAALKIY